MQSSSTKPFTKYNTTTSLPLFIYLSYIFYRSKNTILSVKYHPLLTVSSAKCRNAKNYLRKTLQQNKAETQTFIDFAPLRVRAMICAQPPILHSSEDKGASPIPKFSTLLPKASQQPFASEAGPIIDSNNERMLRIKQQH